MISYSDQRFHSAGADERFQRNGVALDRQLDAARAEFGDTVHTAGRADYVIRVLVNYPDPALELPTDTSCFAIAAGPDRVQVLTKRGSAHGDVIAEIPYDDGGAWIAEIVGLFAGFRESLDD